MARIVLQKHDFDVTEAADGSEALDILRNPEPYDLIVLDLDMPEMRGDEVLRQVRGSMATAGLPVIFLTGTQDTDTEVELMEAGADDYIRKPMQPDRFLVRVKATLRRSGVEHA
jgi:DNA-binding response OmpR family regulator